MTFWSLRSEVLEIVLISRSAFCKAFRRSLSFSKPVMDQTLIQLQDELGEVRCATRVQNRLGVLDPGLSTTRLFASYFENFLNPLSMLCQHFKEICVFHKKVISEQNEQESELFRQQQETQEKKIKSRPKKQKFITRIILPNINQDFAGEERLRQHRRHHRYHYLQQQCRGTLPLKELRE